MDQQELMKLEVNTTVDARGTACPGPLLEAKRGMAKVPEGGIMEVLSSDEGTNDDIPLWAKKKKYEFLGYYEESGYYKLYVKK